MMEGFSFAEKEAFDKQSLRCNTTVEDEIGSMKFCLQYFQSVQQLRVSLFSVKDLRVKNRRLRIKVSLKGDEQKKRVSLSKKTYTESHSAAFNESIYLKLNTEDFTRLNLLIRVYEISTGRFFKKSTNLGGIVLSLDGLNLKMDTAFDVKLTSPELHKKAINGNGIKITRDTTIEEQVQKMSTCSSRTRRRSPSVIRSLPVFMKYGEYID